MESSVGRVTVQEENDAAALLQESFGVAGGDVVALFLEFVQRILVLLCGGEARRIVCEVATADVHGVVGAIVDFHPWSWTAVFIGEVAFVLDEDFVQAQVNDVPEGKPQLQPMRR